MKNLGLEPMIDVMHFGTPLWLKQAVGDPEFPEALERFSTAIVNRYRDSVRIWCPFNEPLVSALFSGDFGFWPPHSRKWRGYMPVVSRIVQAVSRGIKAIRAAMPEATVLLCDAVENYKTRVDSLQTEVRRRNLRRFLVMDLLTGRVDAHHPLYPWLTHYGLSDLDLEWFRTHPQSPDVLGLDYYPHSDWQLESVNGDVRQHRADNPVGLYGIAQAYYNRYALPMMLTETSIEGQAINREIWLESTVEDCRRLRAEGIPMLGYIWWPLVDQLDWDGALTHRIGKIHEVGLFNLKRLPDGTLQRVATPLVKFMRDTIAAGDQRVGKLEHLVQPSNTEDQGPPIGVDFDLETQTATAAPRLIDLPATPPPHPKNPTAMETAAATATATARSRRKIRLPPRGVDPAPAPPPSLPLPTASASDASGAPATSKSNPPTATASSSSAICAGASSGSAPSSSSPASPASTSSSSSKSPCST